VEASLDGPHELLINFWTGSHAGSGRGAIIALALERSTKMKSCCLEVELILNVCPDAWRAHAASVLPAMQALPGLIWKLWTLDEQPGTAGGIYLFRNRAAAEAYADGPMIAALRRSTSVRDVNLRLLPVIDDLSRQTRALSPELGLADRASESGG
jgi:hypothetical protein